MNIQLLNPINDPEWDDFISTSSETCFFHSLPWSKVLIDTYKYKPLYFTTTKNGRMQSLIPVMEINSILTGRRGVSLPFTDYCGPIVLDKQL